MAHCNKCGIEVFPGDQYCHACGSAIEPSTTAIDEKSFAQDQQTGRNVNIQPAQKKQKTKRIRISLFVVGIPVLLVLIFLLILVLKPEMIAINFDGFARESPSADEEEGDEEKGNEDQLAVGPTLTAFALENQTDSLENELIETAEPTADVSSDEPGLIFREDFEGDASSVVPLLSSEYMIFTTISGEGFLSSGNDPGIYPVIIPELSVADFVAEFDCFAPEAYEDTSFGFIFRATEPMENKLDSYYALIIYPQQNAFRMVLWIDGEWQKTDKATFPSPFNTGYVINHVRLEVVGTDMKLYLNDEFVSGFFEDSRVEAGIMGFFISPSADLSGGEIDMVFLDNFAVYQP